MKKSSVDTFINSDSKITKVIIIYERKEGRGQTEKIIFDACSLNPPYEFLKGIKMFNLFDSNKVGLSITPVDDKGNPAHVDGAPQWNNSNEAVVSLQIAEDGMSAVASAVGPLGAAQITVTADADLGEGNIPIIGTLDINILPGQATSIAVNPGQQEPI